MLTPFDASPVNALHGGRPLRRSETVSCIVLDSLAYAAERGIPLVEALDSLPFRRSSGGVSRLMACLYPIPLKYVPLHRLCGAGSHRLSARLDRAMNDLRNGSTLSYALEHSLGDYLPRHAIIGIDRAEQQGRLGAALPAIAASVRFPLATAGEHIRELRWAAFRFIPLLGVCLFVATFILPKWARIWDEMGVVRPPLADMTGSGVGYLFAAFHWLLVTACAIYLAGRLPVLGEWLYLRLPFSRGGMKRLLLAQLARSMYALTADGTDVLTAARWTRDATDSAWLTEQLDVFLGALEAGADWVSAWCEMELGSPFAEWSVRNAGARERPADGFRLLLEKLHCDIDRSLGTWRAWADPVCVLILGVLVGAIAYWMFEPIIQVICVCL